MEAPTTPSPEVPSEPLMHSSLVHPSAGMVPISVHNPILALNRALGLSMGELETGGTITNGTVNSVPISEKTNGAGAGDGSNGSITARMQALNDDITRALANVGTQTKNTPIVPVPEAQNTRMVNRRLETQGTNETLPSDPWAGLFAGSRLAAKGTSLDFVAPMVKEGGKIAQLQKEDLEAMSSKWVTSMVMYIVGEIPTIASIRRFIASNWNHVAQPEIFLHDE